MSAGLMVAISIDAIPYRVQGDTDVQALSLLAAQVRVAADKIQGPDLGHRAILLAIADQIYPARIPEPGLYGAVRARVKRDTSQTVFEWFRGKDGWVSDFGNRADWDQLIVLEVLSEGRAA